MAKKGKNRAKQRKQTRKPKAEKMLRFAAEYLIDLNATAAYKRAGYNVSNDASAAVCACKLLRNAKVAEVVRKGLESQAVRLQLKADDVLSELQRIGYSDPTSFASWDDDKVNLFDSSDLASGAARCIQEISQTKEGVKLKFHSKTEALRLLGLHLKLFTEKREISGPGGRPLEFIQVVPQDAAKPRPLVERTEIPNVPIPSADKGNAES